ncbi:MAG: extracellular solute-binding protein [Bdellovibrionia bacterium]
MKKILLSSLLTLVGAVASANTLTIYTDRPTARLQPIADEFTKSTGAAVTIVELPYKDLLAKLEAEGAASPADLIYTKDLVYQAELAKKGFYQAMNSKSVQTTVAAAMRDPGNLWTAVSYRARTLVYDAGRVDVSKINTYEDLANEEWAGRLCLRTSNNSYNEALVASFIHNMGYDKAKAVVAGMVDNLAGDVAKGDTGLLETIANGGCEIGLANHYYLAALVAKNPNFPVKVKFLDQNGRGTHVNGSGIGIAKTSQNPALAQQFIELLLTDSVQDYVSASHFEYPAAQHMLPSTLIKDWGTFKADSANWSAIGEEVESAKKLVKEVGYL